jgi:hypothetical protein
MRCSPMLLLLMLVASAAHGQTPPSRAEVQQALREALTLQAPVAPASPRLPESMREPVRAEDPGKRRTSAPATQISGEVLDRAGRMATQLPASVPASPNRMGAAQAGAAVDSQSAASQVQAEVVRQQRPPRPGTPGGVPQAVPPPSPPSLPSTSPATPVGTPEPTP